MPAIFDLLYREYCRARLAEMRKQLRYRQARSTQSELRMPTVLMALLIGPAIQVARDTRPTTVGRFGNGEIALLRPRVANGEVRCRL